MKLVQKLHSFLTSKLKFIQLNHLLFREDSDPNVLWNYLIRLTRVLDLLKKGILVYAGCMLHFLYQQPFWGIIFWANIPTYFLLGIYLKYRQKSLKLYYRFTKEIENRRKENISLKLPKAKVLILHKISSLNTFYSFRILFILYAGWIIWSYFYFYPKPQKVQTLISQAQNIESNIRKHEQKAVLRFEKEKEICNKIQILYLHKEKKCQTLQRKVWQRYSDLKQIQHKISMLNSHLTKASINKNYLYTQEDIIEELANWVALKAELMGKNSTFDKNTSDLLSILQDLIQKYHKVKQKAQEFIRNKAC